MYFLLTDDILNPADSAVLHINGCVIDMAAVERLRDEFGIDNFQAVVCTDLNAAASMQEALCCRLVFDL